MPRKNYNTDGPNAEDRAWAAFTGMMIQHIKEIQKDWKKPWFSETASKWPKNMSGREYNGMNAIMLMLQSEKQGYTTPVWATFDRVAGAQGGLSVAGGCRCLTKELDMIAC